MSEKTKWGLLFVLVAVLLGVSIRHLWTSQSSGPAAASSVGAERQAAGKVPLTIPDARLQVELLEAASKVDVTRPGRNIFQYGRVKQPVRTVKRKAEPVRDPAPPPPAPPPPPPLRLYGMAESRASTSRQVFLTDGNEIYVARQGDVIEGRYRIVRVAGDSLELEDLVSRRRWTLWLELPQR